MDGDANLPLSHKPRSGSGVRQKQRRITFRMTEEEYAAIAQNAGRLTLGTYIRECLLKAPKTARRQRTPADVAAFAPAMRQLSGLANNINQLARIANADRWRETPLLEKALHETRQMLEVFRRAMGV